jgi:hypothetical protein
MDPRLVQTNMGLCQTAQNARAEKSRTAADFRKNSHLKIGNFRKVKAQIEEPNDKENHKNCKKFHEKITNYREGVSENSRSEVIRKKTKND